jgi:hypothetical protein
LDVKREEETRGCRRLHNEELHNLHVSPNIIMVIKSRKMTYNSHVARVRKMRNAYKNFVSKA